MRIIKNVTQILVEKQPSSILDDLSWIFIPVGITYGQWFISLLIMLSCWSIFINPYDRKPLNIKYDNSMNILK